jgi:hypothetical protein
MPRPDIPPCKFIPEDELNFMVYGETDQDKVEALGKAIDRLAQRKERMIEKYKMWLEEDKETRI